MPYQDPSDPSKPRYTDPEQPYSGSDPRYQNRYTTPGEYHRSDAPFQFPWWSVVAAFVLGAWPVGVAFIAINAAIKNGKLGGFEQKAHTVQTKMHREYTAVYNRPTRAAVYDRPAKTPVIKTEGDKAGLALGLTIAGVALLATALVALPDGIYWLPDALTEGGYYWRWLIQDTMPALVALSGGVGCLLGANHVRTTSRMRKKIKNIVGDAPYMYIQDIADAIPCSYDKCRKHLENCIDKGLFGANAFLDMRRRCLVIKERPPEKTAKPKQKKTVQQQKDQYQEILDELRAVNDAIPDEVMSDKISRLEAVSAKIFEQAKSDPDKLPKMRKFMDYYLPTSLKLLKTYAELEAQNVEGENITESKHRIEQTMDMLVHAFETQLDQLFQDDAMDVSADIDVMRNMLRADGLTDDAPFQNG
ncbi:5-bromo-4-chloroindolyl phosphate hydrolysis family protein [uncultured Gemmiger sp.]|uniref:5-bromo-4-chloroindolyl phosphate hydrolysis family protein n=1 Tax=uncultured Gemmiger sp. TaxID=1623490 RepID=UPI0027DC7D56|nr:5-bromo-4-chloroindolyl phosphate hydrolysis family protein [uncultured Gemmiger sp.]